VIILQGSSLDDCVLSCTCSACVLSQMARHAFRYGLMSGSSVPAHFSLAAPPVLPPTRLNAVRLPVHANLIHTGPMSGMAGQQGYQVVYFGDYPLEYGRQLPQMQQAGYALA
jgi:hypothetical protein